MKSTKLSITNSKGQKLNSYLELPANQKPNYYAIFDIVLHVQAL